MADDYIAMCTTCKKPVTRQEMVYAKSMVFCAKCFKEHGGNIPSIDPELAREAANLKVNLVMLKNLKSRKKISGTSSKSKTRKAVKSKKRAKPSKKKPVKRKIVKSKTRKAVKSKKRAKVTKR